MKRQRVLTSGEEVPSADGSQWPRGTARTRSTPSTSANRMAMSRFLATDGVRTSVDRGNAIGTGSRSRAVRVVCFVSIGVQDAFHNDCFPLNYAVHVDAIG